MINSCVHVFSKFHRECSQLLKYESTVTLKYYGVNLILILYAFGMYDRTI